MTHPTIDHDLAQALEQLETSLHTPTVPGELPQWSASAKQAAHEVSQRLQREISEGHSQAFKEMRRDDPGLAARIRNLEAGDQENLARLEELMRYLDRLESAAAAVEPDEAQLGGYRESVIQTGLELVLAARKQETAITTWMLEALERDRGDVD